MARPRSCPNCLGVSPVQEGYNFDQTGNLLCQRCGEIMYPLTVAAEIEVDKNIKARTTANHDAVYRRHDAWNAGAYTDVNRNVSSATTQVNGDDAG